MYSKSIFLGVILTLTGCGSNVPKVEKDGDKTTISMSGDDGKKVSITTTDKNGSSDGTVSVKTTNGSFAASGGEKAESKLPSFMPIYPGAKVTGSFSSGNDKQKITMTTIETADAANKPVDFYKPKLTGAGYKITSNMDISAGQGGENVHGLVAENGSETISVMATEKDSKTTIIVTDKVEQTSSK